MGPCHAERSPRVVRRAVEHGKRQGLRLSTGDIVLAQPLALFSSLDCFQGRADRTMNAQL